MNKYILNVDAGTLNSAGFKAKADITKILVKAGYQQIDYFVPKYKIARLMFTKFLWSQKLKNIHEGTFVFQYPMYSRFATKELLNILNKRNNVKKIAIIHDLESLRFLKDDEYSSDIELNLLNQFDLLIVHNTAMAEWLKNHGVTTQLKSIEIFDYLNDIPMIENNGQKNIIFAGNLEKSKFLTKLNIKTPIILKGPNPEKSYPENIEYRGQHTPDELPQYLDGKFGLVWDGTAVDKCDGTLGEYLKYNNPHKTSLYLSMGVPVIIWKQAAIAKFVEQNNVGITIDSLLDIDTVLEQMTENSYEVMKENAEQMGILLREGTYTLNSMSL